MGLTRTITLRDDNITAIKPYSAGSISHPAFVLLISRLSDLFPSADMIRDECMRDGGPIELVASSWPKLSSKDLTHIKKYIQDGLDGTLNSIDPDNDFDDGGDSFLDTETKAAPRMDSLTLIPMINRGERGALHHFSLFSAIDHQMTRHDYQMLKAAFSIPKTPTEMQSLTFSALKGMLRDWDSLVEETMTARYRDKEHLAVINQILNHIIVNDKGEISINPIELKPLVSLWAASRSAIPIHHIAKIHQVSSLPDLSSIDTNVKINFKNSDLPTNYNHQNRWFHRLLAKKQGLDLYIDQHTAKNMRRTVRERDLKRQQLSNKFCEALKKLSVDREEWLKSWGFSEQHKGDSKRTLIYDPMKAYGTISQRFKKLKDSVLSYVLSPTPINTSQHAELPLTNNKVSAVNQQLLNPVKSNESFEDCPVLEESIKCILYQALLTDFTELEKLMKSSVTDYVNACVKDDKYGLQILFWQWDLESGGFELFTRLAKALKCRFVIYQDAYNDGDTPIVIESPESSNKPLSTIVLATKWGAQGWLSVKEGVNNGLSNICWSQYLNDSSKFIKKSSLLQREFIEIIRSFKHLDY